ncbi:MAG: PAS domain-containing protein [Prevotella sp.]|nr:PAS domain-containing protein [Prevotella sp.]
MNTLYSITLLLQGQPFGFHSLDRLSLVIVLLVVLFFILVLFFNRLIVRRVRHASQLSSNTNAVMQQALKISENHVVYYNISKRYTDKLYGHLIPDEGLSAEEWKSHVHPDDISNVLDQLHQIIDGKVKSAEFYYRWNFDYSGGRPRWGYLHNVSVAEYLPGMSRPVGIISTLADETELLKQQEKEDELHQRYKLIFEESIIGLSFYDPEGWLLDANKHMRDICHFDSENGDEFFSNANLFETAPFREFLDKNHVEEYWICSRSDVPERDMHLYLEIRVHPIRDEKGKLTYIALAVRDVSEEREMYLQSKLNDIQIQEANEKIQRYEMELQYMMEACDMRAWRITYKNGTVQFLKGLSNIEREMTFDEYITYFIDDYAELTTKLAEPEKYFTKPFTVLRKMHPIFHTNGDVQWNQINSVPIFDNEGKLVGAFGLIRNMTKYIQAQEQLKHETQRANESGRLKSVFLANMTHEIRTPLNAIVGFSDLLQMMTTTEEKRELIHVIHNNCDMLLRLINDIMAISAMDSNGLIMSPVDIDFAQAFNDICQSLAQRVENPNVEFIKENPYKTLLTHLDVGRMTQVITNFVTNAVKYTQEGHIRVGYQIKDNGIYMYCEDTGTGIPKEQCGKVFERFVKLNDYVQGTGLGLSICKAIADRCDGKIGVDSEVGQGSTFWIWIPCPIEKYEEICE